MRIRVDLCFLRITAIDPGPVESAIVLMVDGRVVSADKLPNADVRQRLRDEFRQNRATLIAIERIASMGMAVGQEVFDTCVEVGRMIEAAEQEVELIKRHEVKSHHCHHPRAKDANIRQALIDRFGGKALAIGTKAAPGPLYGVKGDCWSALAVALVALDRIQAEAEAAA